ncbi:MAG: hypothetical protein WDM76_14990 [Limisphaerales bacterium]
MKFMKLTKTSLIAALAVGALLACSSTLLAQETNTPPAGAPPAGGIKRPDFAKELNLTEDQKPKFDAIIKESMQKRRDLRSDTALTPEEKRTKAKAIQEGANKQLKELLTAEQFAKWEKISPGFRRNGPPGAGIPPRPPIADKPPQN